MKSSHVYINYDALARAFGKHVRKKAATANSTIIYLRDGAIVEEDPKSHTRKVLKRLAAK